MKAVYCPIDTSLNFNQAKKLIRDLKPSCIAVPEQYTLPPAFAPTRTDLVIDEDSLKGGGGGDGASGIAANNAISNVFFTIHAHDDIEGSTAFYSTRASRCRNILTLSDQN